LILALVFAGGCGGPRERESTNARAFEALLTAVSLKNVKELESDAALIEARHDAGDLSDGNHRVLGEIIAKARAGDWAAAEAKAYEFRKRFGDDGAYFR
jgi:hypothetical protein